MRNQIALNNLGLVHSVINNYTYSGIPAEDLQQEGVCGLLIAIDKYDYTKGFKFSTYSIWYTETDAEKGTPSGGEGHTPKTMPKQTPVKGGNAAKAAKTGDNNAILLLCMLFVVSGLTGSVIYRKKRQ